MPIRFRCNLCNQPVEVDDEAAGHSASCPYCQGLTPVPQFSSLGSAAAPPPLATPSAGEVMSRPPVMSYGGPPPATEKRYAALSWMGLAATILSLICLVGLFAQIVPVMAAVDPNASQKQIIEEVMPRLQGKPAVIVTGMLAQILIIAAFFSSAAAVMLKARPIWPAGVGLALSGIAVVMCCLGLAMNAFIQ